MSPFEMYAPELAKKVAECVFKRTGIKTGYAAKPTGVMGNILFTFRVGEDEDDPMTNVLVSEIEARQVAHEGAMIESLAYQVISATKVPEKIAERAARRALGEPDIPVIIDQQQRRHFRLLAEGGIMGVRNRGQL